MKHKVGDKVTIRPDLKIGDTKSGLHVNSDMIRLRGKTMTIDIVKSGGFYRLNEDPGRWSWNDECFVSAKPLKRKKVTL